MGEAAAVQDRDPVAEHLDVRDDVRGEEHRDAGGAQAGDEVAHLAAPDRVEPAHRLVEENDFGIVHERLGQAHPLQHALGELPELAVPGRLVEVHAAQEIGGAGPAGRRPVAEQLGAVLQQLARGEVVVEVRLLGQVAEACVHGHVGDVVAEDAGAAAGRGHEPHQDLDRRGLAGAVAAASERAHATEVQESRRVVLGEPGDLDHAHPRGTVDDGCSVTSQPSGVSTSR